MKRIVQLLFLLLSSLLFCSITRPSSSAAKTIKSYINSYSWSRKTHAYYELKSVRVITETYDQDSKLIKRAVYTKGNRPYENINLVYEDNACKEVKVHDGANKLLTVSRYKKEKDGLYELVYNSQDQLIWYYLYVYDKDGRVREKRWYHTDKKIITRYAYYYNETGLVFARIAYTKDSLPFHYSEFEYDGFDQLGRWTKRYEYQNYADVYSAPKEVIIRDFSQAGKLLSDPVQKGESISLKRPEVSVNSFLEMTEQAAKAKTSGGTVLAKALEKIRDKTIIKGSCYDWINMVYTACGYKGKKRKNIFWGRETGPYADPLLLQPGDWIMFKNLTFGDIGHSGIFLGWLDFKKRSALVIGYVGQNISMPGRFREYEISRLFGIVRGVD